MTGLKVQFPILFCIFSLPSHSNTLGLSFSNKISIDNFLIHQLLQKFFLKFDQLILQLWRKISLFNYALFQMIKTVPLESVSCPIFSSFWLNFFHQRTIWQLLFVDMWKKLNLLVFAQPTEFSWLTENARKWSCCRFSVVFQTHCFTTISWDITMLAFKNLDVVKTYTLANQTRKGIFELLGQVIRSFFVFIQQICEATCYKFNQSLQPSDGFFCSVTMHFFLFWLPSPCSKSQVFWRIQNVPPNIFCWSWPQP